LMQLTANDAGQVAPIERVKTTRHGLNISIELDTIPRMTTPVNIFACTCMAVLFLY
jgi:hypothetical protein